MFTGRFAHIMKAALILVVAWATPLGLIEAEVVVEHRLGHMDPRKLMKELLPGRRY